MRSILWILGGVLAVAPHAASADCAVVGLTPKIMNDGVMLPADGAFVVVADPLVSGTLAKGDVTIHPDWRLRIGARTVAPKIDTAAPGLSLYRVEGAPGTAQLLDGAKTTLASSKVVAGLRTPFPSPVVKKLTYELHRGMHRSESVTAELDGSSIPGGAIAIVMTDAKGTPRSFGLVTAGKPVLPYHSFDCTPLPNGTIPSKTGDTVTLRWVDDAGRLSPASGPITIK